MNTDLILGMAGSGGDGIVSAGDSLMTALAIAGYHAMLTKSFGPQIRGGESSFRMRVSTRPVLGPGGALDVAVALNWDDFLKFGAELSLDGHSIVIYDSNTRVAPADIPVAGVKPAEVIPVGIEAMAKETAGTEKAKNTVVLGLMAAWFGLAPDTVRAGIRKRFAKKGEEIAARNERAFQAGFDWAQANPLRTGRPMAPMPAGAPAKLVADGNDLCAAAAIFAGCQFFGGYPITPSSEIMQFLNREIWKFGGVMLQCEDEMAGIGACVGASFAGKKALTATSGPGMSLKTEILGLATIAELPLVVVNVQRGGPSTGIPTKSEQSDLFQAAFSAHGDAARPVLAPTDVADTFPVTVEAFNIAEHYQTPVIILSDQEIAQRKEAITRPVTEGLRIETRREPNEAELERYARFRLTECGISPISHPGMKGGNYLASGIEHTETGAPTASGSIHGKMNEKRLHKLAPLKSRQDLFITYGPSNAPLGLIAWGSVSGIAVEALALAREAGLKVKLLVPRLLYPVAEEV
ncbi:MAG TPA: 2-oxoacid:acceptor oxidoreductase subunit alpha, partial [Vicinamibacterales bacterium]|nr:2-oxoacid:acceptor oxidoreductase subunit alpha [Vicinamibacterales bacterium]